MPEEDDRIFGEIYAIYSNYRWRILQPEDFLKLTAEIEAFAEIHKWKENPLANRLAIAIGDVFNDLYQGGRKPKIPDYIGRGDL